MIAVPCDSPVTIPLNTPTPATPLVPQLQVPPALASLNVAVPLTQILLLPVIATGVCNIVTVMYADAPHELLYEILAVPAATPVTTPELLPTEAIEGLLLDQVPSPPVTSPKVVLVPVHNVVRPAIEPALDELTTNVAKAGQPDKV